MTSLKLTAAPSLFRLASSFFSRMSLAREATCSAVGLKAEVKFP